MKILTKISFLFLYNTTLLAQQDDFQWVKYEIERYKRQHTFSEFYYPGDAKFDVRFYKLDLTITYSPQNLVGAVTINAKADTQNVSSIFLDLASPLTVDSVILNGNPTTFAHIGDTLNVDLDGIYNQNDPFSLIVYYHGVPVPTGYGSFVFDSHNGVPMICTLSEPYGAKDWWPCKDTPADKADSAEIWITVSTDLIPVSNGKLVEVINNGNGTHTYKWKENYPIAQYLISLAITNYIEYTNYYKYSLTDSMPITNYIFPETFDSTIQAGLDKVPEMIGFFSYYFGQYPFINEKFGQAEWRIGGAMEHQTIISTLPVFASGVELHELVHQWFGDLITCKDWHHIWLNEGFADYAPLTWFEVKYGKPFFDGAITNRMNYAKQAEGSIWVEDITDINNIFDYLRSYVKGGIVLHMLRGIVGDSTFYDIMRAYTSDPSLAYGVATTEDFQEVVETVSGLDLDYFFQEWIYGENYPNYRIYWSKTLIGGDLYELSFKLKQEMNTNPPYFTMPVQLKVHTAIGDTIISVFNNQQIQDFNVQINGEPIHLDFDPNNYILEDVLQIINGIDEFTSPTQFILNQNYPNPFNPVTSIQYAVGSQQFVALKVYDVLGNEIATLVNEEKPAGEYEVEFNASNLPSGIYFYQLKAGSFIQTKKMVLLK